MSAARACGVTPKETLLTPRIVSTPGNSALMRRMPSSVCTRAIAQLFLSGGHGEGQRVEEQRLGGQPILVGGDLVDAFGDLDLALDRLRHALLVNGQRHHRRAMLARQRQHRIDALPPVFQVDRVDDGAARIGLQRGLHHTGLGGVDHQRRLDAHLQLLDRAAASARASSARSVSATQTSSTCAPPSTCSRATCKKRVVVVGQQRLLHLAAALRVDALAHQQRRGILLQRRRAHAPRPRAGVSGGASRRAKSFSRRCGRLAAGRDRGRPDGRRCGRYAPAWCHSSRR